MASGLLLALSLLLVVPGIGGAAAAGSDTASPSALGSTVSSAVSAEEEAGEAGDLERYAASGGEESSRPCLITGRCVSAEADIPLPDASVRHFAFPHSDVRAWTEQKVTTDADGRFRIVVAAPEESMHEILLGGELYCLRRAWFQHLEQGADLDLGTIELKHGSEVRGAVADEAGLPVTGADLLTSVPGVGLDIGGPQISLVQATIGEDGFFSFGPLPPGDYRLSIGGAHLEMVSGGKVTVPEAPSTPVVTTVTVRRLPLLHVRVMDPQGRAVPGALVRTAWRTALGRPLGPLLRTNEEGTVEFDASPYDGARSLEVWAWASGFAVGSASVASSEAGTVAVALQDGESLWLRVRDAATGLPVERFGVVHGPVTDVFRSGLAQTALEQVRDSDGRCRLVGIGGDHRILVRAVGYSDNEVRLRGSEPGAQEVTVELQRTAELEIVVLGIEGGAGEETLEVVRDIGDRGGLSPTAPVLATGRLVGGRALIRGIPAGSCWVRPGGAWCAPFGHGPIVLDPGGRERLTVDVVRGCTITGTVVPPEARAVVTGARLMRADGSMGLPLRGGVAGFAMGEDGAFRWTGVPPGEWNVEVSRVVDSWANVQPHERPYAIRAWVHVATLDVTAAPELEYDLDLRGVLPGRVRGFLLDTGGLTGRATLRPIGHRSGARWVGQPVDIGSDGSFSPDLAPGSYRWMLYRGDGAAPRVGILLEETVEVRAGEDAVATLTMPATEEVELVFADELLRSLKGNVWIRYQAAAELRAGEYAVSGQGRMRVEVASGEPFFLEAPPHGTFRPERIPDGGDGGVAQYIVKGR